MRSFQSLRRWLGIELVEVGPAEKIVSAAGGALALWLLIVTASWVLPQGGAVVLVASMGASAVLVFAAPHGQLSQPWPVIAGHGVSALIGVLCAQCVNQTALAAACAVGLSISAMHQLKCIHPPGGATALTAVIGGQAVHELGFHFVVFPVLTNAAAMVLLAVLINYAFRWRRYPAGSCLMEPSLAKTSADSVSPTHEEIITALRKLDSFVDVSEDDLIRLVHLLSKQSSAPS
jgi:CBS domain-containing membrane protein